MAESGPAKEGTQHAFVEPDHENKAHSQQSSHDGEQHVEHEEDEDGHFLEKESQ